MQFSELTNDYFSKKVPFGKLKLHGKQVKAVTFTHIPMKITTVIEISHLGKNKAADINSSPSCLTLLSTVLYTSTTTTSIKVMSETNSHCQCVDKTLL